MKDMSEGCTSRIFSSVGGLEPKGTMLEVIEMATELMGPYRLAIRNERMAGSNYKSFLDKGFLRPRFVTMGELSSIRKEERWTLRMCIDYRELQPNIRARRARRASEDNMEVVEERGVVCKNPSGDFGFQSTVPRVALKIWRHIVWYQVYGVHDHKSLNIFLIQKELKNEEQRLMERTGTTVSSSSFSSGLFVDLPKQILNAQTESTDQKTSSVRMLRFRENVSRCKEAILVAQYEAAIAPMLASGWTCAKGQGAETSETIGFVGNNPRYSMEVGQSSSMDLSQSFQKSS
ncbi:hypothetical protein Tco_0749522 [Tanacetum coccineum]|uniref:Uncharacterized protein n=1 Tax=Tanacetum coccineum TaxID=301880 RepID=A0ABQ4Z178_9ASTR